MKFMEYQKPLKAIGYWQEPAPPAGILARYPKFPYHASLPNPKDLIDPLWRSDERMQIMSYLRAGKIARSYNGSATCRLCVPKVGLGTHCLSDGDWIWPQGLHHYIEKHKLSLPDEFVDAMRRNHWQVLNGLSQPFEDKREPDYTFWTQWAAEVKAGAELIAGETV